MKNFRIIILSVLIIVIGFGAYKYKQSKKAELENFQLEPPTIINTVDKTTVKQDNITNKTETPQLKEKDNNVSNTQNTKDSIQDTKLKKDKNELAKSNSTNIVDNPFLTTEKEYNESIINEMMESRALEISNLKQQNEIAQLAGSLRKNMYSSITDMLKEDEMLKRLMILGFIQREFGLNIDPNSYIALEKTVKETSKKKEEESLLEKYKSKLDNLDSLKEDILREVEQQLTRQQSKDVGSQIEAATGVKAADMEIVDKINDFVKNYLDQNLRISGIYKINNNVNIYAELEGSYLELEKGSILRKLGDYVNISVYNIDDKYAKFLIHSNYKTANKSIIHSIPLSFNSMNVGYQPSVPNYYLKEESTQANATNSSSSSTPVTSSNNISEISNLLNTAERITTPPMPQNRPGFTPQYYTPAGRNRPILGTSEAMQPRDR